MPEQCTPYSDLPVDNTAINQRSRTSSGTRERYDPYLDNITEYEMVPDIIHRLTINEDLTCDAGVIAKRHEYLDKILANAYRSTHFPSVLEKFSDVQIGTIEITAGSTYGELHLPLVNNYPVVLAAYSKQTGMDYKELIIMEAVNGILTLTLNVDVPFTQDDEIQIFLG